MMSIEAILKEAGFTVSEACYSRPSCFDYAARKDERVVFVKIQPDIGNLSLKDSQELKTISEFFSAASILVGEKTRDKPLEDDTIYSRYEVLAFTPKTLESTMLRKIYPFVQASPGGYYVKIDGETIRRRRQELGLSAGEMAKMIGISRRTLYGYERGMAKASVTATYNLMSTLGIPVVKALDIFETPQRKRKCFLLTTARQAIAKNNILQKIFRKFSRYRITAVKKAPFDFVISAPEGKMWIIGGVAGNEEHELDRRVDEILSVSMVVQAHPILVTDGLDPPREDINCIRSDEFSMIRNLEDLIPGI
jgi:putative transcriptional regulator